MASAPPRHHAGHIVGYHHLVALIDDAIDRRDDSPVPLAGWPDRRHFHFSVNGVADIGRSMHLHGRFQHGEPGMLHRGLNQEAFNEAVAKSTRHRTASHGAVLPAERHVGEDHLDHTSGIDEIHQISFGDGAIDGAKFLADLEVSPEQPKADILHALSTYRSKGAATAAVTPMEGGHTTRMFEC